MSYDDYGYIQRGLQNNSLKRQKDNYCERM